MSKQVQDQILNHLKSGGYRPSKKRQVARQLKLHEDDGYAIFRDALRVLIAEGRVAVGEGNTLMLPQTQPTAALRKDEFVGTYRQNKRGFGFVVPTDPTSHEDLFIPPGENAGAITGDLVRARIVDKDFRGGKPMWSGRVVEIVERKSRRFVGSLAKVAGRWVVQPDGNVLTEPILVPDAASRHIRAGTKVVVELTSFPGESAISAHGKNAWAEGVITEVLGAADAKDVDLKSVIVQYALPEGFPESVKNEATTALARFKPESERAKRLDLTGEVICTIDPDDAKDYDDAISLKQVENGYWELGVHIADVSHFVKDGTAMDQEALERGNSTYFPGHVIPMLPEVLSNGVCSLQEGVPRLCKSAFITLDDDARPVRTRFANTIIKSAKRLRYTEAQALIDGASEIPHPDGKRRIADYEKPVLDLLRDMNLLAKRIQKRRRDAGQLVLSLPEVDLVLDDQGRVTGAVPEDQSFTHTLIEMFMVEANEAVARLLDSLEVPFLRRTHPAPDLHDNDKLRHFAQVTGHHLPKEMGRKELQKLLEKVKGTPEEYAISLAVLKSLTRAEYSPETIGHYALASEHYAHFTSPIRRYADLTIHRLLDAYFAAGGGGKGGRKGKVVLDDVPTYDALVRLGQHLSITERRSEEAERELRQIKILTLMQKHVGDEFPGVVTGITNFGLFVQLNAWLVDGLIRYEDLMGDYWQVDDRSGMIRGRTTGKRIGIGDVVRARVVKVDLARRELDLAIVEHKPSRRHQLAPMHDTQSQRKQGKRGKHLRDIDKKHRKMDRTIRQKRRRRR